MAYKHRYETKDDWRLCTRCGRPSSDGMHHKLPLGWESIESAPKNAKDVEVRMLDGTVLTAHWAQDLSGEYQPAFSGWFRAVLSEAGKVSGYAEIDTPEGWRPLQPIS